MTKGFIPYREQLTTLARENRKNPTPAEAKIWHDVLRNRQFAGLKFLRQKPLAGYIVDFYSSELRLVIEIDGDSHTETVEYDIERTNVLKSLGLSVVRYTNEQVLSNSQGVYEDLVQIIASTQPPSVPPCQGGSDNHSVSPKNTSHSSSPHLLQTGERGSSPEKGRRGRG